MRRHALRGWCAVQDAIHLTPVGVVDQLPCGHGTDSATARAAGPVPEGRIPESAIECAHIFR